MLKELGLHREPVGYGNFVADPFFSWYCHLFLVHRHKCLLFVNILTRYPVIAVNLSRNEIRHFNGVLGECLKPQLDDEGVPDAAIYKFLEHLYRPEITKSNNRSVIGTAVEYEQLIQLHVDEMQQLDTTYTQTQISLHLARTPILTLKPDPFPYNLFSSELLKRYGETGHFRFDRVELKPCPLH